MNAAEASADLSATRSALQLWQGSGRPCAVPDVAVQLYPRPPGPAGWKEPASAAVNEGEEWQGSPETGKHLPKGGRKKGFITISSFCSLQASQCCPGVPLLSSLLPHHSQQQGPKGTVTARAKRPSHDHPKAATTACLHLQPGLPFSTCFECSDRQMDTALSTEQH